MLTRTNLKTNITSAWVALRIDEMLIYGAAAVPDSGLACYVYGNLETDTAC